PSALPPRRCARNLRVLADRWILFCVDQAESALAIGDRIQPSTLLNFHRALVQRKYRLLFSPKCRAKPGPKGPNSDNRHRAHASLEGQTPIETPESRDVNVKSYSWQKHCRGLYQTPTAA